MVGASASITAASVNNGSSDNCGPVTLSVSKTTFACANIGANTVILTVTDASGNTSTCTAVVTVVGEIPTCSITSIPNSSVFTEGVSTNLYLGYGATATTLQVSTPASGAPYIYSWSGTGLSNTNTASPVFKPTTAGVYNFTVTTTNKYGCTTTCTIRICVTDIRVFDKKGLPSGKVYICHIPPGNPGNPNTLEIRVNAVPAHIGLHGGDRLGSCSMSPCGAPQNSANSTLDFTADKNTVTTEEDLKVTVMPNPTTTYFTLKIESKYKTPIELRMMNAAGRVVEARSKIEPNSNIQIGYNYANGKFYAEIIKGTRRKLVQLIKAY